ncbi:hypothetical protein A3750_04785 [Oleiphilus sp. HI0079]|nr:hypothetical protein A3750_04785 [Oleiphilus sp. HI0079]
MWSFIKSVFKFFGLAGRFIGECIFLLERGAKKFEQHADELNKELESMVEQKRAERRQALERMLEEDKRN